MVEATKNQFAPYNAIAFTGESWPGKLINFCNNSKYIIVAVVPNENGVCLIYRRFVK
jgi:hypothetical protein